MPRTVRGAAASAAWLAAGALLTWGAWGRWDAAFWGLFKGLADAFPLSWPLLATALAGHAAAAAGVLLLLASAGAAGGPVAAWAGVRGDRGPWSLLAGWGLLSLAGLAAGLTGLLRSPVLAAACAVLAAAGLRTARAWRARITGYIGGEPLPAFLLSAVFLAFLMLTRLPGTHEDPMVYHFAAPEEYLRAGRIHAEIAHIQWTMPLGLEMLYLLPWWAGGITAAKLVNVGMMATACAAAARLGSVLGGSPAWAALLLASAGLAGNMIWQGKNDIACAAFAAGAGLGAAHAVAGNARGWLAAGWCAGCAVACRLTAGIAMVPLGVFTLLAAARGRSWRGTARGVPAAVAACAAACGPWLARSWLDTGNPFTLFASGLFPDLAWSPFLQEGLRKYTLLLSAAGPFRPTDVVAGAWNVLGSPEVGSAALFILFACAAVSVRGTAGPVLLLSMAAAYAVWLPTERNPRFLLPLVPWAAAFAAAAGRIAPPGSPWRARAARRVAASALVPLGVAASCAALVHACALSSPDGPAVWTGRAGPGEVWLRQNTTVETARRWVRARLPGDARILLTGGSKRLGFGRRVMSTGPIGIPPFWKLTRESWTPGEVRKRLRQRGATHWMHNFVEGQFRGLGWFAGPEWDRRQFALGVAFMRRWARPVRPPEAVDHDGGGIWIFEFARAPGKYPAMFLPGTEALLRPAFDLRNRGDPKRVLATALRIAGTGPLTLEMEGMIGYFAVRAGAAAAALKWLAPGIRAGFVGDGNLVYLAVAEFRLGRLDEALRDAARAAMVYPTDRLLPARILVARARRRGVHGDAAGAARDRSEAERWFPGALPEGRGESPEH